ncbi:MAG: ComEA family DNA-binding protein [Nitrospiraceae bacterium]
MFKSLLLKAVLLGATVAVVLWIGWPMPSPAPSDPEPKVAQEVTQGSPAESPGVAPVPEGSQPGRPARDGRSGPTAAGSPAPPPPGRLDINRATLEELQTLPGIGEVLARRVIEQRIARGSFRTVEDLLEVKGIGVNRLNRLRPFLTAGKGTPNAGTAWQAGRGGLPEKRKL